MGSNRVADIFYKLNNQYANAKIELNYTNYYTLLLAVVLSAQATDKGVNKSTEKLFKVVNSPLDIINMGITNLVNYIKNIGLYNSKSKNIINLSQILLNRLQNLYPNQTQYSTEQINSIVPNSLEQLMVLPGVGRKTANVILNQVYNMPTIAVDTHVYRVSKRLGLSKANNVLQVEKDLLKIIPKQYLLKSHYLLILFGRYQCKARNYNCGNCILFNLCNYKNKVIT